jgi:ATP-binding cassette subfamily B protein
MKRIFANLKPLAGWIVLAILCVLGQTLLSILIPQQVRTLSVTVGRGDTQGVWHTAFVILGIAAGIVVLSLATMFLSAKIGATFSLKLRGDIFKKVQSLSVSETERFGTASLTTRTTNDVMQMQIAVIMFIRIVFTAPLMLIGGFVMALQIQPQFSVVYAVSIPLLAIVTLVIILKGSKLFISVQKKLDAVTVVARENLTGVRVIRAFNREDYETQKFTAANKDLTDTSVKVNRLLAGIFPASSLIMNMTVLALIVVAAITFNGITNTSSDALFAVIGDTAAVTEYAGMILGSIIGLAFMFMLIPRAAASANRIAEVLTVDNSIDDPAESKQFVESQRGKVEFRNVTFAYPDAESPLLHNISFTAQPGQTTAIIGSTGSGKSTVANLIPRFYDTTEGDVFVGGINVKDVSQHELRERIGFVTQNALLFSGTVRENVEAGEHLSDEQITEALTIAQAKEMIDNSDDGLDHSIVQGGKNLSGGQKQRLSIARAIAKHPDIYVFDDSFSALDFKTDKALRTALNKEISTRKATLIIVAQRVSTVLDADKILVMDNGQLLCTGTHKELIRSCETYREIVLSQINEEEAGLC